MWHIRGIHSEVMSTLHLDNNHVEIDASKFQKKLDIRYIKILAAMQFNMYIYRSILHN